MWGTLLKLVTGGALDALVARIAPNKDAVEANRHAETAQQLSGYAGEFTAARPGRTWWDSAVDGLNRLPRPAMALGVLALMAWAPLDPVGFAEAMQAYALVPEWLAATLFGVAAFYFTTRHFERRLELKGPSLAQIQDTVAGMRAVRALDEPPVVPLDDQAFADAFADEASPLSNAAILEWNRRRGKRRLLRSSRFMGPVP